MALAPRLPEPGRDAGALRLVERKGGRPPGPPPIPTADNARVAVVMFMVAESMFFAGLIGAYIVFRVSTPIWPPSALPRLPIGITWVNTLVLMASAWAMLTALRASKVEEQDRLRRGLVGTAALGALFVAIQGSEWVRLVGYGLTLSSGTYGGTFYVLIGAHAAHVLGALLWVLVVAARAYRGAYSARSASGVEICAMYWFYVCALWLVLFALVYR
jgi:heme/copper-type cytochrome/quinol oxidase subunit 3